MTTRKKTGILKGRPRFIPCRFCPAKFEDFGLLRFHAQTEHQRAFRQVNRSLAAVDAKLRSFEKLAEEGMVGKPAGKDNSYENTYGNSRQGWWIRYLDANKADIPDSVGLLGDMVEGHFETEAA